MPSAYSLSSLMVKNRILVAEDLPVIFSPTSISALISVVTLPCRGTGLELTFREEQPDIAPATRRVDAISAFSQNFSMCCYSAVMAARTILKVPAYDKIG